MSETLIDDLLAVIAREVGAVSLYARIEIERAAYAIADAADERPYRYGWEIEPEQEDKPDATTP